MNEKQIGKITTKVELSLDELHYLTRYLKPSNECKNELEKELITKITTEWLTLVEKIKKELV